MGNNILEEFTKNSRNTAYKFVYEEKVEKVRVFDNWGYEIKPEVAVSLIEGMTNAYINMSQEDMIRLKKQNADNEIEHYIFQNGPSAINSEFRKTLKKDWGFTCKTCKKKVSSKNDTSWWRIYGHYHQSNDKYCSKKCIQLVIDEIQERIKFRIYERFGVENN
ncbi:hypothetical protein ACQKMD_21275 [Viridibacillus sp. NPDC096237]|uniref:hypothetical protein n=1 Tax=Viridibacillus sp. NPDC096237 TaxID=3390721 RepID=UPI003CFD5286